MTKTIGIRREDKNEWERRVPLIPADIGELSASDVARFIVQPSPIRIFKDGDYRDVGVEVLEDLALDGRPMKLDVVVAGDAECCFFLDGVHRKTQDIM